MKIAKNLPFRVALIALVFALSLVSSRLAQAQDELGQAYGSLQSATASARRKLQSSSGAADDDGDLARIVIYHTNDIHGHIMATPANPKTGAPASGGAASLATLLEGSPRPYLWIDSGDWFQGTPEGNLTRGRAVIDIFNRLHLTAAEIGNHDYDYGEANLKELIAQAHFPVLGGNIASDADGSQEGYASPYIVKKIEGVKIGFIGLLTHQMSDLSAPEHIQGLQFQDEIAAAKRAVQALKKKHVQLIIAVTHIGIEQYGARVYDGITEGDIAVARAVPEISVILGGHTHTEMTQPLFVAGARGGRTMITQTGGMLTSVYQIVLTVSRKTGALRGEQARLIKLDPAQYAPDPKIARVVADDVAAAEKDMRKTIGSASAALDTSNPVESAIGDWISDAIRSYAGADIGAMNTGGIRGGLPAGTLTYHDVFGVMPFDDYIVKMQVSGRELKKAVEQTLGAGGVSLQYSGLQITYRASAPAGQRLVSLLVNGVPVDDNRVYTVATIDFVANVDGSFKGIQKTVGPQMPMLLRDVLAQDITAHSPVAPPAGGRVVVQ